MNKKCPICHVPLDKGRCPRCGRITKQRRTKMIAEAVILSISQYFYAAGIVAGRIIGEATNYIATL
jgi:hypothetical protein